MSVTQNIIELQFNDIVVNNPIDCGLKAFDKDHVFLYYGNSRVLAERDVDYTIDFGDAELTDFTHFIIVPLQSLLDKIQIAIENVVGEENTVFVQRMLPFTTSFTETDAFTRRAITQEFDRTMMRFQQLDDRTAGLGTIAEDVAAAEAAAASAQAMRDQAVAARDAAILLAADKICLFPTRAAAIASTVQPTMGFLILGGYYVAGDAGHSAVYKRLLSAPGVVEPWHFQTADGAYWELLPAAWGTNVCWHGAVGDYNGTTGTDNAVFANNAVRYADGMAIYWPRGRYYTTDSVKRLTSTTVSFINGMKHYGHGDASEIIIGTSGKAVMLWDVGYTPTGTTTGTLKFTRNSAVHDMKLTQVFGLSGCDGLRLTAAWSCEFHYVKVEGMSAQGINVPWRSDIYAAVSDYWQCFSFDFGHCIFQGCTGAGVNFVGGQSPGLWSMRYCTIANNLGGGISTTNGQFVFSDNLVVANGTNGGAGGMYWDASVEGVSFNAQIERNEFDTNFGYHMWAIRVRNADVGRNRFLTSTYDSATGSTLTAGSAFARPAVHVKLGNGSGEVTGCTFLRNYHRSVTSRGWTITGITKAASAVVTATGHTVQVGYIIEFTGVLGMTQINGLRGTVTAVSAGVSFTVNINSTGFGTYTSGGTGLVVTTAAVVHYAVSGTNVSLNKFDNDITAPDGINQNSFGSVLYNGFDVTLKNNIINEGPVQVIAQIATAQNMPISGAIMTYATELLDTHNAWSSTTFTPPNGIPMTVDVSALVTANGAGGLTGIVIQVNNVIVAVANASGSNATAHVSGRFLLAGADILRVHAQSSSGVDCSTGTSSRLSIGQVQ